MQSFTPFLWKTPLYCLVTSGAHNVVFLNHLITDTDIHRIKCLDEIQINEIIIATRQVEKFAKIH